MLASAATVTIAAPVGRAQTTQPAQPPPASLQALDRDVQKLYGSAQEQIVRVTVPVRIPTKLLEQEHPLAKWRGQLDPKLREQIDRSRGGQTQVYIDPRPTIPSGANPPPTPPPPTTAPADSSTSADSASATGRPADGQAIPILPPMSVINIEFVGLILNSQGDVLLPLYVDAGLLEGPLRAVFGERQATGARVVGADRQTGLTVVRLGEPLGKPARLSLNRPVLGSMMLFLSPQRRMARMGIWTGGQDENAIIVNLAGDIAGLVRNGHLMLPSTFGPVVEQLIATGTVQRAKLGVIISEVPPEDGIRATILGTRPAARVISVVENSAAAEAGLQAGDLILSVGQDPVEDVPNFAAAIANRRGKNELHILRDGRERVVVVDLKPE
jgi:hypothetical protein